MFISNKFKTTYTKEGIPVVYFKTGWYIGCMDDVESGEDPNIEIVSSIKEWSDYAQHFRKDFVKEVLAIMEQQLKDATKEKLE